MLILAADKGLGGKPQIPEFSGPVSKPQAANQLQLSCVFPHVPDSLLSAFYSSNIQHPRNVRQSPHTPGVPSFIGGSVLEARVRPGVGALALKPCVRNHGFVAGFTTKLHKTSHFFLDEPYKAVVTAVL